MHKVALGSGKAGWPESVTERMNLVAVANRFGVIFAACENGKMELMVQAHAVSFFCSQFENLVKMSMCACLCVYRISCVENC